MENIADTERRIAGIAGLPMTKTEPADQPDAPPTARHLLPWSRAGVLVVLPSGLLLFIASATEVAASPVFRPT